MTSRLVVAEGGGASGGGNADGGNGGGDIGGSGRDVYPSVTYGHSGLGGSQISAGVRYGINAGALGSGGSCGVVFVEATTVVELD